MHRNYRLSLVSVPGFPSHELGHQFGLEHDARTAHDGSLCLMNQARNREDEYMEFCLDDLYHVRDNGGAL